MADTLYDIWEVTETLKNPRTSEVFHGSLLKLSNIVRHLIDLGADYSSTKKVIINSFNIEFDINPGADILEHLEIVFQDCTLNADVHCNRFSNMVFIGCEINTLLIPHEKTQVAIEGGKIKKIIVPRGYAFGRRARFQHVFIESMKIGAPLREIFFDGCTFQREVEFNIAGNKDTTMHNLYFTNCLFECSPDFLGCKFSKSVNFENCKFNSLSPAVGKYYRDLKHKMSDNQDDLNASFFAGLELKTKHYGLNWGIEYCLSHAYGALSDHGLDQFRPVKYWLSQMVSAFCIWGAVICFSGPLPMSDKDAVQMLDWAQMLYLTFISILGPLRLFGNFNLLKFDTPLTQLLLWGFTATASLFWFFIILAIRRRFKVN